MKQMMAIALSAVFLVASTGAFSDKMMGKSCIGISGKICNPTTEGSHCKCKKQVEVDKKNLKKQANGIQTQ
jgi:hypothetical protein